MLSLAPSRHTWCARSRCAVRLDDSAAAEAIRDVFAKRGPIASVRSVNLGISQAVHYATESAPAHPRRRSH